jgi:hypothetical protein
MAESEKQDEFLDVVLDTVETVLGERGIPQGVVHEILDVLAQEFEEVTNP